MSGLREFRGLDMVAELDMLRSGFRNWLRDRRADDPRGQYTTQLSAIDSELTTAIAALREAICARTAIAGTGEYFRTAAADGARIIWLRSVWDYFRQKFDQRDDPVLGPVLHAADEVVWSCYKPFFGLQPHPPAPLCCIDASYVPTAVRPDHAPHQLGRPKEIDDGALAGFLRSLPVPILRLPPSLASAPWSFAIIGHEIGHFIQRLLPSEPSLFDWLSARIEAAVRAAGGDDADVRAWLPCTEEIFADLYFVLTMGTWAIWAITPWLLGPEAAMLARQRYYPAPVVRLRLLAAVAESLGLDGADTLRQEVRGAILTQEAEAAARARDLVIAEKIAETVVADLPDGKGSLRARLLFRQEDFATGKTVDLWSQALVGGKARADDHDLRTARLVSAACVKAHHDAAALPDPAARAARLDVLRQQAPIRIRACHATPVRGAAAVATAATPRLARLLLDLTEDALLG